MKFMTMVTTANPDKAGPPPLELYQAIAELGVRAGEALKDNGGMSTVGTVSVKRGELIVDGPYAEAKEAVGGFAIYELDSKEEAVRWAYAPDADNRPTIAQASRFRILPPS